MLCSAKYIKKELEDHNVLEKAYNNFPEYNLVLTGITWSKFVFNLKLIHLNVWCSGHSLGAGTAVLLAFYMRELYPNLKVYAFATPGKNTKTLQFFWIQIVCTNDSNCTFFYSRIVEQRSGAGSRRLHLVRGRRRRYGYAHDNRQRWRSTE